jgi:hypothetical protein
MMRAKLTSTVKARLRVTCYFRFCFCDPRARSTILVSVVGVLVSVAYGGEGGPRNEQKTVEKLAELPTE